MRLSRGTYAAGLGTLLLHAVFFVGLKFSRIPPKALNEPTKTYVDLREPPPPIKKRVLTTERLNPQVAKSKPARDLRNFLPSSVGLRTGISSGDVNTPANAPTDSPRFDDPQSYSLSGRSYDEGNAIRGFLEAIYNRINNRLVFDSILAQYGHFGSVYIQFNVDRRGVIDPSSIRTSTQNKILKVHVIRSALLPGLGAPLKENLWLEEGPSRTLRARFEFLKGSVDQNLYDANPEKISGLALSFRRFTPEVKVARTLGAHLVNGGLSYDPFAMYDSWEKYLKARERRRLDTDPFSIHRADEYYDR